MQDDFGLVYGMLYALTGDGLTERQLSDYAGLLKRELGDLDGVARVEIYGEREECIDISILPEKMAMLGVSPAEALATLNGQNNVYYAGYYDNGPDRIRVAVADKFRAVKEIESMVIQGHEDDQLRLCDIARVEHGYAEPVRNEMSYEGQRALGIAVAAASGSDIVKVGAEVERCLAELQAERFPAGVACHKIFYQPRAGQGCAGDVSDKPDRVGGDRRGHSDAYDGFPQRNDHRHQSGGDRRGIVPDSGDGRRNDAARVAGGVHPGHGNAGRQCHRDRGRHPDRHETRETAPRGR